MTIRTVAIRLLRYIGVTSLDPADNTMSLLRRGLDPTDLGEVVTAINGAMQELFKEAPAYVSERPLAKVIRPPVSITFGVTQYETAITGASGYAAWMEGCTIAVTGDTTHNRILSATQLLRPYMSGTGTVSGLVYCDSIPLPSNIRNVLEPVEIPGRPRLDMAGSVEEFNRNRETGLSSASGCVNKSQGEPTMAFAESHFDELSGFLPLYLRFNTLPVTAIPVTFRVKMKPPEFTEADIDTGDHETDPGRVIPVDWVESILLPLAIKRFMRHPNFSVEGESAQEIMRQAAVAVGSLQGMKPQISRTKGIYAQG